MPRSLWTGSISFGLVTVPVKLFSATEDKDIRFHQFERGTGERVRIRRVAEGTDREVEFGDIDKGYEVTKGQYVIVTPEELESVDPGRSKTIDIEDFVGLEEIDPVYFQSTYVVAPANEAAARPYKVLQMAMERSGRAAIARFVMRSKQHLAVVRPVEGRLLLETLYFSDEVRAVDDIRELGYLDEAGEPRDREIEMAEQLLDSLTTEWEPSRYEDTYRERVLELIESKAEGRTLVTEEEEESAPVIDLMAALEASVKRAKEGRAAAKGAGGSGGAARSSGSDAGDATDELAEMSKDELYEEAQRLDIPGRSKMGKDDLVEAIRSASGKKGRRAS
ncbi:non-homologous end joining protein Ku [Actinomarinicola tropica]|uniref:Non-homologous end joining protein Ku n=1 Tax=Actinomarinicola tropica TaxID=2789776 RepID=A0A5Q2RT85_9ACTN|nr:Ku protein [Actinomarinicola tropica]QGG96425.1 Ku protein [Actinomarinicola tropica]